MVKKIILILLCALGVAAYADEAKKPAFQIEDNTFFDPTKKVEAEAYHFHVEYRLEAGQRLIVDTGNVAMVDSTVSIDIQRVKGAKNIIFGGEGLFNTVITGPGRVTLQTISFTGLVNTIAQSLPSTNN